MAERSIGSETARKGGVVRKIFYLFGAFAIFIVAAAAIIPFVVDVDQYRPQIVQLLNERLNGRAELGRLKLTLWGQMRIEVDGLKLSDAAGREVVSVDDAYFHFPWGPLLSGSPVITFRMNQPKVRVVRDQAGEMNLMKLWKGAADSEAATGTGSAGGGSLASGASGASAAPAESANSTLTLPALVYRARLGVELSDAFVGYSDRQSGLKNELRKFNLTLKDISLSRPTALEAGAELATRIEQDGMVVTVAGPVRLTGSVQPEIIGTKLSKANVRVSADLSGLDVAVPGLFRKKSGVTAVASGRVEVSQEMASIPDFTIRFHNLEVQLKGGVKNLGGEPSVRLMARSNSFGFEPWRALVPMLEEYELAGSGQFKVELSGRADQLAYRSYVKVAGVSMKAPGLKARPVINASFNVEPDHLKDLNLSMSAPGTDVRVTGEVRSFTAPAVTMSLVSKSLDLDQLLDLPKEPSQPVAGAKTTAPKTAGHSGKGAVATPAEDYDALIEPLRANPYAAKATFNGKVRMDSILYDGMRISDLSGTAAYAGLKGRVNDLSLKVFDGTVKGGAAVDLAPKRPVYNFQLAIDGLDLRKAVAANVESFRNTLYGTMDFNISGSGASLNPEAAKAALNAKGRMEVKEATFVTIDVGRMVAEAVNGSIDRVAAKVPPLKGKRLPTPKARETVYSSISADFTVAGGKFSSQNFSARARENQGIDLNGRVATGLINRSLNARFVVVDTYNVTKARDIDAEVKGVKIESVLAEKGKPVTIPVTVSGTIDEPRYSYTEVPEHFAKVALANTKSAAAGKVKAEARKKVEGAAKKALGKAAPSVQDKLKKLGKGLFKR